MVENYLKNYKDIDIIDKSTESKTVKDNLKTFMECLRCILNCHNSSLTYEEIYRLVHQIMIHNFAPDLYRLIEKEISSNILYHANKLSLESGDQLLEKLYEFWKNFKISKKMILSLTTHFHLKFIVPYSYRPIKSYCKRYLKELLFLSKNIGAKISEALSDIFNRYKQNQLHKIELFKNVCSMLEEIDHKIYLLYIEEPLIEIMSNHYDMTISITLRSNNFMNYIKTIHHYIEKEKKVCAEIFNPTTTQKLMDSLIDITVLSTFSKINKLEYQNLYELIQKKNYQDLCLVYSLFKQKDRTYKLFLNIFQDTLTTFTNDTMKNVNEISGEYKKYLITIDTLWEFILFCRELLQKSFYNDESMKKSINKIIQLYINNHKIFVDYLAAYINTELSINTCDNLNSDAMDRFTTLFNYIKQKDLFIHKYELLLIKRLLKNRYNLKMEEDISNCFKITCGFIYSSKIDQMLKDITTSIDLTNDFNQRAINNKISLDIDFEIKILKNTTWSQIAQEVDEMTPLPYKLLRTFNSFREYFYSVNKNQKLLPINSCSQIELTFTYPLFVREKKSYIFKLSLYQYLILNLFVNKDNISYSEILSYTSIPPNKMVAAIYSMTLGKLEQRILVKSPDNSKIAPGDIFNINKQFYSNQNTVIIQTMILSKDEVKSQTFKDIGETKQLIKSLIVNKLKFGGDMKYQDLFSFLQTKSILSHITHELFDEQIDNLIASEFIIVKNDTKMYSYYVP